MSLSASGRIKLNDGGSWDPNYFYFYFLNATDVVWTKESRVGDGLPAHTQPQKQKEEKKKGQSRRFGQGAPGFVNERGAHEHPSVIGLQIQQCLHCLMVGSSLTLSHCKGLTGTPVILPSCLGSRVR